MFIHKPEASTSGSVHISIERGKSSYLLSDEPLAPVDKDKILKDFRIIEEAQTAAKKGLPHSDARDLSPTEQKIQDIYQEIVTRYAQFTDSVLTQDDKLLQRDKDDVRNSVSKARLVSTEFKSSLEQMINGYKVELQHEKKRIFLAHCEYSDFQKENNLNRPCKECGQLRQIFQYFVLAVVVIFEAVVNAHLFSTNMEGGLVAGFGSAAIFSFINAVVCFSLGKSGFVGNIFHVNPFRKLCGVFAWISIFVFVISFGLFVGHYREALQVSVDDAGVVGLKTFLANPLGLTDMMSWILFLITLVMGTVALFDGIDTNDLYPGYSAKTKKFNDARERWEEFYESLIESMNCHQEEYLDKFNTALVRAQNGLANVKATFLDKETVLNRYSNAHKNAQKAIRNIVGQYRYENELIRTSPAPVYFKDFEVFDYDYIPPVIAGKGWSVDVTDEIKVGQKEISSLNELVSSLTNDKLQIESEIVTSYKEQRGALDATYADIAATPTDNIIIPQFSKNGMNESKLTRVNNAV